MGVGTVSSAPAGIGCPGTCSAQFSDGAQVTLTATPANGDAFSGWSGGGCSGTGTCQLTLSSDTTVTASFAHGPPSAPNTRLAKARINSKKRTAAFTFQSVGTATGFRCALARGRARLKFGSCASPKRYRHLRAGKYTFEVRATLGGLADPTPAKKKFTIRP